MEGHYYFLKVALNGSRPEIWRRFVVPADISLDRLHDVIQVVMGWQDSHLHEFLFGRKRFTEDPEEPEQGKEEAFFRLCDLIHTKGKSFTYLYDFGDSWSHEITLEHANFRADHLPCAFYCIEGEGCCPPEDCGGINGFYHLLSVLENPDSDDYDDTMTWLQGIADFSCSPIFSPTFIDLNTINYRLGFCWRWSRTRYLPLTE